MCDFYIVGRKRIRVDCEAVIMRGNLDPFGQMVKDWMIRAPVSEFQLVCFAAKGETQDLVAQANAEDWCLADEAANVVDLRCKRLWVAWPVREEDSIGFEREDVIGGGQSRDNPSPYIPYTPDGEGCSA